MWVRRWVVFCYILLGDTEEMASPTVPLVVLCEVLSLFLLTYTSALSLHWPERQNRVVNTMRCWKLPSPSETWDLVAGSSSSYLPPLCYRIFQKASKPHEQINACLVQSCIHRHDQIHLNTRDGSGVSSSWNPPSMLTLMTCVSWITL